MNVKSGLFGIVSLETYFNLAKVFVFRLFKMVANQTSCSRLEQSSVIKFMLVEKNKIREIYRSVRLHVCVYLCVAGGEKINKRGWLVGWFYFQII